MFQLSITQPGEIITAESNINGSSSPSLGAVVVDANLSPTLALGHGALLLCPLARALSVETSGANHRHRGQWFLTKPGGHPRIIEKILPFLFIIDYFRCCTLGLR